MKTLKTGYNWKGFNEANKVSSEIRCAPFSASPGSVQTPANYTHDHYDPAEVKVAICLVKSDYN